MKAIIEYIREAEIMRQSDWGSNILHKLKDAQVSLGTVAWETKWETYEFKYKDYEVKGILPEPARYYHEDIGLIVRATPIKYQFVNWSLRYYLTAEYGNEQEDSEIKKKAESNRNAEKSKAAILALINQLRQANGLERLEL